MGLLLFGAVRISFPAVFVKLAGVAPSASALSFSCNRPCPISGTLRGSARQPARWNCPAWPRPLAASLRDRPARDRTNL